MIIILGRNSNTSQRRHTVDTQLKLALCVRVLLMCSNYSYKGSYPYPAFSPICPSKLPWYVRCAVNRVNRSGVLTEAVGCGESSSHFSRWRQCGGRVYARWVQLFVGPCCLRHRSSILRVSQRQQKDGTFCVGGWTAVGFFLRPSILFA